MSEQEKSGHNVTEQASVVMVEKEPTGSRHKAPFRPTGLQNEQTDQPHIRSKAPAVPSVVEELKNLPEGNPVTDIEEAKKELKEIETETPELNKRESKKSKKRGSATPETIALTTIEVEPPVREEKHALPAQPIPADVISITSAVSEPTPKAVGKLLDEEELAALSPQTVKRVPEWSDDEEEAGGLPRSESRSSRVSRAVRQLFCCGTAYSPPSEDDVSTCRMPTGI